MRRRGTAPTELPHIASFHQHGDRYRLNMLTFKPEDAKFVAMEAARDDCSPADVIRRALRVYRRQMEMDGG